MKKKTIALIMLIPILLIFTVFSAAGNYSMLIDVSVGGITLESKGGTRLDKGLVRIDMSNNEDKFQLLPQIFPLNATDKSYLYTMSKYKDKPLAAIKIDESGMVTPLKTGMVAVNITTKDGGFKDKIVLDVVCRMPTELSVQSSTHALQNGVLEVAISDQIFNLTAGTNSTEIPNTASQYNIVWQWQAQDGWQSLSSCTVVAQNADSFGVFQVLSLGRVRLRAVLDGKYAAQGKPLTYEVEVAISNKQGTKYVLGTNLSGAEATKKTLAVVGGSGTFGVWIDQTAWVAHYGEGTEVAATLARASIYNDKIFGVTYQFNSATSMVTAMVQKQQTSDLSASLSLSIFGVENTIALNFELDKISAAHLQWVVGATPIAEVNGVAHLTASLTDKTAGITISKKVNVPYASDPQFESQNTAVATVQNAHGATVNLNLVGVGDTKILVQVAVRGADGATYFVLKSLVLSVVLCPTFLNITANAGAYGLRQESTAGGGDSLVLGAYNLNAQLQYVKNGFQIKFATDAAAEDIVWRTSDPSVARVDGNATLTILKSGLVTIFAESQNAQAVGKPLSASIKYRCVADAANIYSYAELMRVAADGRYAVVLQTSLGSSADVADTGGINKNGTVRPFYATRAERDTLSLGAGVKWYNFEGQNPDKLIAYTPQRATSDLQYNQNAGAGGNQISTKNTINVGVKFAKDVYGNGYFINANDLTKLRLDQTGTPILEYDSTTTGKTREPTPFNGAVVFVAANKGETYTVFGQDNIAFFISGDNVLVENIQLQSLDSGVSDLTSLDYSGTTVEVQGQGIKILYSRLKLGRTVLRAYSGNASYFADDGITSLVVENCILGQSREFTLRIGANKTQKYPSGVTGLNYGPTLNGYLNPTRYSEAGYASTDQYNNALLNNQKYKDEVIRTYVTVKNTVFEKSGIFAIGMDSHFAGHYLNEKTAYGWEKCSGTSYGAQLTLQGEVRFYDWKNIKQVNSASLIGLQSNSNPDPFGMVGMMTRYDSVYKVLFRRTEIDPATGGAINAEYVHSGIAFFGGGRNYSLIDNQCTDNKYKLNTKSMDVGLAEISLSGPLAGYMLGCAGDDKFHFYMNGAEAEFNLLQQEADNKDGTAYDCIKF